jgi:predicted nuclease of predicted toxin-antitoxin system
VKFKLDENLPAELVADLHGLGYDAGTVTGEGLSGAADPAVVNAALAADRICSRLTRVRQSPALPDSSTCGSSLVSA